MENLIEKLEGLGFTKNFLQIVKEQNLSEFSVPDIDIVEYSCVAVFIIDYAMRLSTPEAPTHCAPSSLPSVSNRIFRAICCAPG